MTTCNRCSKTLECEAILDSETWEQICQGDYALCPSCIDVRLSEHGLTAQCELTYTGKSLKSVNSMRARAANIGWRWPDQITTAGLPLLYK